jgi:hypothetical protein
MELDDLLIRYFGVSDLSQTTSDAVEAGIERALVEFGLERDRGKRFAIWSMLYLLGRAPDLDVAFKDTADQNAARNLMDLLAAAESDEDA